MVNVDFHMRAEMGQNCSSRWLTIRLQFMGAFSLFVTSLGICLFPHTMDAGLTGMVINYALQATGTMESFIQVSLVGFIAPLSAALVALAPFPRACPHTWWSRCVRILLSWN